MACLDNYNGCPSVNFKNEYLKVAVLPSQGGKVSSIYSKDKGFEFLFQNPKGVYKKARLYDKFEQFDASGFDDAFPTIDACKVAVGKESIGYPDHGEVWTMDFDYKVSGNSVLLFSESKILPYRFEKSILLDENRLFIHYNIENTGKIDFPCLWAMHCLLNCEKNMKLLFPKGTKEVLNVLDSRFLGHEGTIHRFPVTQYPDGTTYALNKILPESSQSCEKFYVNGKVCEGICGVYYPSHDATFKILFDNDVLSYLGFWVTEGGFRGDYNCAMEPTNGFYDSVEKAKANNAIYTLNSGSCLTFDIEIEVC